MTDDSQESKELRARSKRKPEVGGQSSELKDRKLEIGSQQKKQRAWSA